MLHTNIQRQRRDVFLLKRKLHHQQEARTADTQKFEREREALQTELKNVRAANIVVEKKLDSSNEQLVEVNKKNEFFEKKFYGGKLD